MRQEKKIFLVGKGHLGEYISKLIPVSGFTKRKGDKNAHLFSLDSKNINLNISPDSTHSIWTIPPHPKTTQGLSFLKNTSLIFISSTGVFDSGAYSNDSSPDGHTSNAKLLTEAENFIKKNFKNYLIIRPAGLVDSKRHPKRFFQKPKSIPAANHRVNLVHTEDVARLIKHHLESPLPFNQVNIVSKTDCTKKDFYLPLIKNQVELRVSDKSEKSFDLEWMNNCNFELKYPDLQEYFKNNP